MIGVYVVVAIVVAVLVLSVRIANEWQRAVVLRLGRFLAVKGPGLYLLLPVLDRAAQVIDMRIQTTAISAEQALTRDTVAVGVDAIVFWQVRDPEAAAIRIANYREAIERVAQTSMREMIGASDLGRLLSDRRSADEQLRVTIGEKTASWGVAVISVEIRDVAIPRELQDAMSRQAQAEREKSARVTLASAEQAIAEQVLAAARMYAREPTALTLRQMGLLYEMNKERGVTVPDSDRNGTGAGGGCRVEDGARIRNIWRRSGQPATSVSGSVRFYCQCVLLAYCCCSGWRRAASRHRCRRKVFWGSLAGGTSRRLRMQTSLCRE